MGVRTSELDRAVTPPRGYRWRRFSRDITPYLLISPFLIGFPIFSLLPTLFSLFLSLAEWNGMTAVKFTGLNNFIRLVSDGRFWNSFRVTLTLTVVALILGTVGSLLLAVLLEKVPDRLSSPLRVIFFLPSVTSVVVITFIWKQLYSNDYGFFNTLLEQAGLPGHNWLLDPATALPALIVMLVWAGLGWDALIITAGLRSIPGELYDAAKVDGANDWSEFWTITLPLLRPTLLFVMVTSVIFLWGLFAQAQLLTNGGPLYKTETVALYLYNTGFRYHRFGLASAIAIVLSLVMFISSYLNYKFVKSDVEY